jgi:hypothetical protein
MIRARVDGHAHPLGTDPADTNSLTMGGLALTEIVGSNGRTFFLSLAPKGKQFLDANFERTGQTKRNFRVREIRTGFYRVNRLTGDPYAACELRGTNSSRFPDSSQVRLNI